MTFRNATMAMLIAILTTGCGQQTGDNAATAEPTADTASMTEDAAVSTNMQAESFEIMPGLTARILRAGNGEVAAAGDSVVVHYTGWLYDDGAADRRGDKFDSSVDRGEHFQFPLGAGRVIKGWDQGVAGMAIGELRELTIAPEMGYGARGAGDVIPPGATLVFEVELFELHRLGLPTTQ
ncbi:MAG: FKBP-type peptidyl-prolyl cis-trans isomerase [Gammaproteobacteria bacterium]|nr:FKBP-type peptidyl-prolyl cis-trans isomerase [Gammaproteobacteria bacterium]MDH5305386.1 FKBP-type peptidyl-prolyl cis-trans isomerase [Gammaproteobacteria bacterium]MDH5323446.1 FKBP-type peptidyl-prolyl cis-trans isomerase [Gammaproteobacteria bacterium]